MKINALAISLLLCLPALPVRAAPVTLPINTVAEIFTADTSTCAYQPQGDQEIKNILAKFPDILVLTCHDSYLSEPVLPPEEKEAFGGFCRKRKVEYAGFREIYTFNIPLVMVNGHLDLNASYPAQIPAGLSMAHSIEQITTIPLAWQDGTIHFSLSPGMPGTDAAESFSVRLFAYRPETDTRPEDLMGIVNPVTAIRDISYWDKRAQSFAVPVAGLEQRGFAITVQAEPYGKIIAAGKLEIPQHASMPPASPSASPQGDDILP